MFWIIETCEGDFEATKLKSAINLLLNNCVENQQPSYITDIYAVINYYGDDKERLLSTAWINKIQDGVDKEYKVRLKEYKQEIKAQKELESDYWEGRL